MNADRLMDALGNVREDYILEAAPGAVAGRPRIRRVAVVAALVALLVFTQTAPGIAALEMLKEAAADLIETMFPPKTITVQVEGDTEVLPHEAGGQTPDAHAPGFVIYYDTERYQMTVEGEVTYIRPVAVVPTREEVRSANEALLAGLSPEEAEAEIDALLSQQVEAYAALPVCELEIVRLADVTPDEAAQAAHGEAVGTWERVTEVTDSETPVGKLFNVSTGDTWDAPRERVCFTDDGRGGTFRISTRFFREATEGHGARFAQMLQTFRVLTP